ncbi:MAG: hypothetical protein ABEJ42_02540 [Halobacteriaceae archaeon]
MVRDTDDPKRRKVLKTASAALGGLMASSGVAAAERDATAGVGQSHGELGGIGIENGRFEVAVSERRLQRINSRDAEGVPAEAQKVPPQALQDAVEDFNAAIEAGHFSFEERDGRQVLTMESDVSDIVGGDE